MGEKEEIVMTAMKKNDRAVMRLERKKKNEIDYNKVAHIAGGPYKGILVNKTAEAMDAVQPAESRIEFMAYIRERPKERGPIQDMWTLLFWFRGTTDGMTKKKTATDYFQELFTPGSVPKNYIGFVKRALVLLQSYKLIQRIELEVQQSEEPHPDEELGPITSYTSVFTPASYTYQFVPEVSVNNKDFLVFKIKAAAEAHMALSAVYSDVERKTHEIVIGAENNTKSIIRDGSLGPIKAEAKTMDILNEKEFRFFWVCWKNGRVEVGRGQTYGQGRFLNLQVPSNRQFNINCLAVSTGRASKGEWEFAEIIEQVKFDANSGQKDSVKEAKRNKIRASLLWIAKKQRMLQSLEEAYPNPVQAADILKACKIKQSDGITAMVMLKELEKKKLIQEIEPKLWMRVQSGENDTKHEVKLVKEFPVLTGKEQPTIGVITGHYCEKLAVDAMIEDKITFVKYKTEGESQVYTVGRIGKYKVVSTKLSRLQGGAGAMIAAENTVTRLLGTFSRIEHIFLIGVGGAVPHYSDYTKHVRLGDVVVSLPVDSSGAMYLYCSKVEKIPGMLGYSYVTRAWDARDQTLQSAVKNIRQVVEMRPADPRPWDRYVEEGKDILRGQESNFHRPKIWTDKLFFTKPDGTVIQCEHPRPRSFSVRGYQEGQVTVRYGVIASGKIVARAADLRRDFSQMNGVKCFDVEYDAVLDSLEGNRCDSFLIIRGISDYVDGTKKEWQPYASLVAAAYMKAVIMSM